MFEKLLQSSWLRKFFWTIVWWIFWSFIYSRFFTVQAHAVSPNDVLIRAIFPNPVGSDTAEWILLENTGSASVSGSLLKLGDLYGSTKEYVVSGSLLAGELRFIPATQSGIVLNNDTDAVNLKYGGVLVQQTEAYTGLAEDMVWWQREDGEWGAIARESFLQRFVTRDWTQPQEALATRESSENESLLTGQNLSELQSTTKKLAEISKNSSKISEGKTNSYNAAQNAKIDNILIYRYNFKMPILWQSMHETAKIDQFKKLTFPEYDYASEKRVFESWKRQALLGSLLISGGGAFLCISIVPQLWGWYVTWSMRW